MKTSKVTKMTFPEGYWNNGDVCDGSKMGNIWLMKLGIYNIVTYKVCDYRKVANGIYTYEFRLVKKTIFWNRFKIWTIKYNYER